MRQGCQCGNGGVPCDAGDDDDDDEEEDVAAVKSPAEPGAGGGATSTIVSAKVCNPHAPHRQTSSGCVRTLLKREAAWRSCAECACVAMRPSTPLMAGRPLACSGDELQKVSLHAAAGCAGSCQERGGVCGEPGKGGAVEGVQRRQGLRHRPRRRQGGARCCH